MAKASDRQERAARAEQMRKERERADRKQRNAITVGIVVLVVALIALAGFAIKGVSDDNKDDLANNTPKNTTDDYGIVYTPEDAGGKTSSTKPVSVELFEDFQCPGCRAFEAASGQFIKDQLKAGTIEVTYRPYSFLDSQSQNEYSSRATNAALCALDTGGVAEYAKVHDYLYLNQPEEGTAGPEDAELVKALEGVGAKDIESCVRTKKFGKWIEAARDAGTERGVSGTPAVYVDGKQVEDYSPAGLEKAIKAASGQG